MFAWQATVQDEKGNAVPSPIVAVYNSDGSTLADIYDESGAALENPFTGTAEGFVQFWALAGDYVVDGTKGTTLTEKWFVFLGDEFIVKDAADFFSRNRLKVGVRYSSQDGLSWDTLAAPAVGDFIVAGIPVRVVPGLAGFGVLAFGAFAGSGRGMTEAIQSAINRASSDGDWLNFPEGTFTLEGVSIPVTGISMRGAGWDHTVIRCADNIGTTNMVSGSGVDGIEITGFTFDGRNTEIAPTVASGENILNFVSSKNVSIHGNKFKRSRKYNIVMNASVGKENDTVRIYNNVFEDGNRGGIISPRYNRNWSVWGNRFINVCNQAFSGIAHDKSISVGGVVGAWIHENYVHQSILGGGTIIVEYHDRQSESVYIYKNYIEGLTGSSIKVGASDGVWVMENSSIDSSNHGIYIEGCRNTRVERNLVLRANGCSIRIYEDAPGQTDRDSKNVWVLDNILKDNNQGGYETGIPTVRNGVADAFHIATRESESLYIRGNKFINSDPDKPGCGIWMQGQNYFIEDNDFREASDGVTLLYNTSTTVDSEYNIENNAGLRTTQKGLSLIPAGQSSITVTHGMVREATNFRLNATLRSPLNGSLAYFYVAVGATPTFSINLRSAAHAITTTTENISFMWEASVTDCIGSFAKTS